MSPIVFSYQSFDHFTQAVNQTGNIHIGAADGVIRIAQVGADGVHIYNAPIDDAIAIPLIMADLESYADIYMVGAAVHFGSFVDVPGAVLSEASDDFFVGLMDLVDDPADAAPKHGKVYEVKYTHAGGGDVLDTHACIGHASEMINGDVYDVRPLSGVAEFGVCERPGECRFE